MSNVSETKFMAFLLPADDVLKFMEQFENIDEEFKRLVNVDTNINEDVCKCMIDLRGKTNKK
jgi:hypothetical protein